jgi:F-type H+-transporting ATPase subunit delta
MNDSKISVRYAKALFESAKDKDLLDEVRADMEVVQEICGIPEFNDMLANPVMKESQKYGVLDKVLGKRVQPLTMSLLNLVFHNGRELFIPAIARNYINQYKKHKGIISATFTSAVPISASMHAKVEKIVRKALNTPIELKTEENEDLIGGFVIRIDDQQYDASVANSLKELKKELLN